MQIHHGDTENTERALRKAGGIMRAAVLVVGILNVLMAVGVFCWGSLGASIGKTVFYSTWVELESNGAIDQEKAKELLDSGSEYDRRTMVDHLVGDFFRDLRGTFDVISLLFLVNGVVLLAIWLTSRSGGSSDDVGAGGDVGCCE